MMIESSLGLAAENLTSPMVLFFLLGAAAGLARSDLEVPEPVTKAIALYLMLAIGFKGGVEVARAGLGPDLVAALGAGIVMSAALPLLAFAILRLTTPLGAIDAAAIAAHYGSISVVTFVAAAELLRGLGIAHAGFMVAVLAVMETPAIMTALWLARRGGAPGPATAGMQRALLREILLNGSVVLLLGSFVIGWISGPRGFAAIAPFVDAPFRGVLCLFLLAMGLVAAAGLRDARAVPDARTLAFAIYMPLLGALAGLGLARLIGLDPGSAGLLAVLGASASYIAVPAALRLALPEANAGLYLTLAIGVTFPFNLTLGIPLYLTLAGLLI
jgi:uncharacterized protein